MTLLLAATFLLVVGLVGATVSATPTSECAYTNYRLPKHIVPKHYNLVFNIDAQKHEYRGDVIIDLAVKGNEDEQVPNDIIVLHAHPDITIISVEYKEMRADLSSPRLKRLKAEVGFCRHLLNELLVINLDKDLAEHTEAKLTVSFSARIRGDRTGIYSTGDLISTDFKPDRARRAFPCFDEPSFKATFDISLYHDRTKTALANTALHYENDVEGNRKLSEFETTPLMSTYLIAFAIGEFEQIEETIPRERGHHIQSDASHLKIRAFTSVGKSEQARFALETAVSAIEYMEEYFNHPFPLKKLDMLSGVELYSGARENWGLIAFTDSLFLYDEATTSPISRAHIARAVIHQLALQWFGNLVTMKWWNDLWLTEGFAGFMELNVTDHLYPELQVRLYHLIETHQDALNFDSQDDVRPIRVPDVGKNIEEYLDEMVYYKSVEVIRLLHDAYLGPEQFKFGIRRHIFQYKHKIADASDLWRDMKGYSQLPVDRFIESWTEKAGHPLVEVRMVKSTSRRLILKQVRDRSSLKPSRPWSSRWFTENNQDGGTWIIPVTVRVSDGAHQKDVLTFILDESEKEVQLPDWFYYTRNPKHWLKVNENSQGFYRVDYTGKVMLQRLEEHLKGVISLENRIGLIEDVMVQHRNNQVGFNKYVELLEFYKGQIDGSVVGEIAKAFSLLHPHPDNRGLGLELFKAAYIKFGLRNELFQNARNPDNLGIMDVAGLVRAYDTLRRLNYSPFIDAALKKFDLETDSVPPRIRQLVYDTVDSHGDPAQKSLLKFIRAQSDYTLGSGYEC